MSDGYEENNSELLKENLKQNIGVLIERGLFQEASSIITAYEKLIKEDSDIVSMKADIALKQNDLDNAARYLQECLSLDSSNHDMLYKLGKVYEAKNKSKLAEDFFKRAFKMRGNMESELTEESEAPYENKRLLKNVNIYIRCPAMIVTGGPELLHQLCYKLNVFGYNAWMFYRNCKENHSPTPDRYKKYNTSYVTELCDDKNQIVIVPETAIEDFFKFPESRKIIWWLSVDHFLLSCQRRGYDESKVFDKIRKQAGDNRTIHFAQSQYAMDYLKSKGIDSNEIYYLSDYLNDEFMKQASALQTEEHRLPNILFNPKKGYEFTSKLMELSPELNWIPLTGYTPEEMRMLMNRSMVYVDFGNHPGKDRIPREAAICGCCIVVGKCGAARNPVDIPIPEEFKIERKEENIELVVNKIRHLLNHYHEETDKFSEYRNMILNEEGRFEDDLYNCLERLDKYYPFLQ